MAYTPYVLLSENHLLLHLMRLKEHSSTKNKHLAFYRKHFLSQAILIKPNSIIEILLCAIELPHNKNQDCFQKSQ